MESNGELERKMQSITDKLREANEAVNQLADFINEGCKHVNAKINALVESQLRTGEKA